MNLFFDWIKANYLELFGAISGIVYIFLSVKQNIWLWPLGIFSSALQAYVFLNSRIYADMSLQLYYLVISVYGWYFWIYGKRKNEKKLSVITTNFRKWIYLTIVTAILFLVILYILKNHTNSDVPYLDSFTTAASITGTWLLARKHLENWFVWIIVDSVSAGLYIYKDLYYLAGLYLILSIMSVKGYFEWKKGMALK